MGVRELTLDEDPDGLATLVRALSASFNVRLLHVLVEARRKDPEGGWLFLSDIAKRLDEAPGSVSAGLQKLLPLLEEKRVKGRRYFRSRLRALRVLLDVAETPPGASPPLL